MASRDNEVSESVSLLLLSFMYWPLRVIISSADDFVSVCVAFLKHVLNLCDFLPAGHFVLFLIEPFTSNT